MLRLDPDHEDARMGLRRGNRWGAEFNDLQTLKASSTTPPGRMVEEKESDNVAFKAGEYQEALGHYTQVGAL